MTMTTTDVTTITPLAHPEAMRLQAHELERTLTLLRSLDQAAWAAATDCPGWDIRAMYQHVLGACEAGASMRENIRQLLRARAYRKQHGGPLEAALSAVQISDRAALSPTQVTQRLEAIAPKTVRGRARTPALLRRHASLAVDGPVCEKWKLGYLIDTIYVRDLWMHRIDAARAAGQPPQLTAGHDGRIIADITAEWARRHRQPFLLDLTGPAGASYASDPGSPPPNTCPWTPSNSAAPCPAAPPPPACSPPSSPSDPVPGQHLPRAHNASPRPAALPGNRRQPAAAGGVV